MIPKTKHGPYHIEVLKSSLKDSHFELLVRAWNEKGAQIAFGDGTVDIERIKLFNPSKSKLDSSDWVLDFVKDVLDVKKEKHGPDRIVAGKVGNTTSTFNPSLDGWVDREVANQTWSEIRDGAGTTADTGTKLNLLTFGKSGAWDRNLRIVTLFDTSSIPDTDTISAATLTIKNRTTGHTNNLTPAQTMIVVVTDPASTSALAASDYNIARWTMTRQHDAGQDQTPGAAGSNAAWEFNATGIGNISKTGISKFGIVFSSDFNNSEPTNVTDQESRAEYDAATGGANDPTLVVEHAAGGGGSSFTGGTGLLTLLGVGS